MLIIADSKYALNCQPYFYSTGETAILDDDDNIFILPWWSNLSDAGRA